eukprot:scaffold9617_cov20-Tisochrysis_lutea.AAC.1
MRLLLSACKCTCIQIRSQRCPHICRFKEFSGHKLNTKRHLHTRSYTNAKPDQKTPPCAYRFYELSGHYPEAITVVSYNLKRDRFKGLHRMALHYPEERFKFVGTELPAAAKGAKEGEVRCSTGRQSFVRSELLVAVESAQEGKVRSSKARTKI